MRLPWSRQSRDAGRPRHVEIWGEIEETSRFLRWLAILTTAWAFLALAGAAYALHVAMTRPLAFVVDADGRAALVGRLAVAGEVSLPEVRYVAKEFLRRHIAVNSLTIESDLAAAENLMTTELQAEHRQMLAAYEREHGHEFVAFVKEQGIQMTLDIPADKVDVRDHQGLFTVKLVGIARTWPLSRVGQESAFVEREIEALLTLVRCPRTELTPNGLLVSKVVSRFYVAEEPAADLVPVAAPGPSPEPDVIDIQQEDIDGSPSQ